MASRTTDATERMGVGGGGGGGGCRTRRSWMTVIQANPPGTAARMVG
jgi:hypothetical protein